MSWDDIWSESTAEGATHPTPLTPADAPADLASVTSATTPGRPAMTGVRKGLATALLAAGLLVVGGVAIVNAADPSASPAPSQASPDGGSGGTSPSQTAPRHDRQGGTQGRQGHLCPNMGGGSNGSDGGSSGTPTPNATASPDSGV
jgi:hypothetical protein